MTEKCCNNCRFYAELKQPYKRSDGAEIFGYCFKSGDKNYSPNMGKGYPIFLDGAYVICKNYKCTIQKSTNF